MLSPLVYLAFHRTQVHRAHARPRGPMFVSPHWLGRLACMKPLSIRAVSDSAACVSIPRMPNSRDAPPTERVAWHALAQDEASRAAVCLRVIRTELRVVPHKWGGPLSIGLESADEDDLREVERRRWRPMLEPILDTGGKKFVPWCLYRGECRAIPR